jgi:hypothetical protein
MTVASLDGVMATMFRLRWILTVQFLELAVRVVFLSAIFRRPALQRRASLPGSAVSPR